MTTTANGYKLGATSTSGSFKLLSVIAVDPESTFTDAATRVKLANGKMRGLGYPLASWNFGYLTQDQWTALKAYCTEASSDVYIATMGNDGTFIVYTAVMSMPDQYTIRATRYVDITISFNNLVAVG